MSYEFGIRAANTTAAKAAVAEKLAEVVGGQPAHNVERAVVQQCADGLIDALKTDTTRDICVSVNGSISAGDDGVTDVHAQVHAHLENKE